MHSSRPPEQQHAAIPAVLSALADPAAAGVLAAGRQAAWAKQRQFRTVGDAVAWLKANRPDIDLDAPYTPRRSGRVARPNHDG